MEIEKIVSGPIDNNTYIIFSDNKAAVIDPSFDTIELIKKYLQKNNLKLEKILLTHSHWDHIAGVKALLDEFDLDVYIHILDSQNLIRPGSDNIPLFYKVEGSKPTHFIEDNDIIDIGGIKLKVIHTPGHTRGGVCFYNVNEKILFSGDTLFNGSYGRVDLPTSNASDMVKSLKKLSALPKETQVFPGHGKKTTIQKESWLVKIEEFI